MYIHVHVTYIKGQPRFSYLIVLRLRAPNPYIMVQTRNKTSEFD